MAASTWIAPSVVTLDRVAAAVPSGACEIPKLSADVVWLDTPPLSLREGGPLDSSTTTFAFLEQGPVVLPSDLRVNRTVGGSFTGSSNEGALIPAGTRICSYYVHGDKLEDSGTLTGELKFGYHEIIGLIYRRNEMLGSSFLEYPGTAYFRSPMETNDEMQLTLSSGSHRLWWLMRFANGLDGIRIITSA